jgi:aspartate aminotransferase
VHDRLQGLNRIALARPEAALYAFLKVDGLTDSLAAAKSLLAETRVGLAPGIAFGAGGEGHLRICFANSTDRLNEALDRLVPALAKL